MAKAKADAEVHAKADAAAHASAKTPLLNLCAARRDSGDTKAKADAAAPPAPTPLRKLTALQKLTAPLLKLGTAKTAKPPKREEQMRERMAPPKKLRTVNAQMLATLSHDELRSAMEGAGLGSLVEPTWHSLSRLRDGDPSPEALSVVAPEVLLACDVLERTPPTATSAIPGGIPAIPAIPAIQTSLTPPKLGESRSS